MAMKTGMVIEYADNGMILYNKDNKVVVLYGDTKKGIGVHGESSTDKSKVHERLGSMLLDELETIGEPCGGYILDIKVKLIKQ
jgi:hypothetical protein